MSALSQLSLLRIEFEELLIDEAWLLDTDQLETWLEQFTDDIHYWAPVRQNVGRAQEDIYQPHLLTHMDDDKLGLTLRVKRLRTGAAHAEEPPSRQRHFVSNVKILQADDPNRVQVASNLMVFRSREGLEEHLFVAGRRDWWRREQGRWRLAERLIMLEHDMTRNITVFF